MKKFIVSKALKERIPLEIVKEIYRLINALPASGMEHHFCISPDTSGTNFTHSIPLTNFNYSISLSKYFEINEVLHIIAYDTGEKIMMALSSEIK